MEDDIPWDYEGFDPVLDEWGAREAPDDELQAQVLYALMGLRQVPPPNWLARREATKWVETYLCVVHLGTTDVSFVYAEDRHNHLVSALHLGRG